MTPRRRFSTRDMAAVFLAADGRCYLCGDRIDGKPWDAHHKRPLALGGEDTVANLVPVHVACHKAQTATEDVPRIAKAKRQHAKDIGAKRSRQPMPGSRGSRWRKRMNGTVERRE